MSVTEIFENQKLRHNHISRVLKLFRAELVSYRFHRKQIAHYERYRKLISENPALRGDVTMLTRLHKLSSLAKEFTWFNAQNILEFFYGKDKPDPDEYFFYHFPLDEKEFERKRINRKRFELELRGSKGRSTKSELLILRNADLFLDMLNEGVSKLDKSIKK